MSTQTIHPIALKRNVEYISDTDLDKCFLCDDELPEDEKPWLLFEKWDPRILTSPTRAEIIGVILDTELFEDTAHSKNICGRCNSIIHDYERLRKRVAELKNKIVSNYERTLERLTAYDELVLQKYGIMKNMKESFHAEDQAFINDEFASAETNEVQFNENEPSNSSDEELQLINDTVENERSGVLQDDVNSVVTIFADCDDDQDEIEDDNILKTIDENDAFKLETIDNEQTESVTYLDKMLSTTNGLDTLDTTTTIVIDDDDTEESDNETPINPIFGIENQNYHCRLCPNQTIFPVSDQLLFAKHLRANHDQNLCPFCLKVFKTFAELTDHLKISHGCSNKSQFKCNKCPRLFENYGHFFNHKCAPRRSYVCKICSVYFKSSEELNNHTKSHNIPKIFGCTFCPKKFQRTDELNQHLTVVHKQRDKSFKCNYCEKAFTTKSNLKEHTKCHNVSKPFACEKEHDAKPYNVNKPFSCTKCSKSYTKLGSLDSHRRFCTHKMNGSS